MLECDQPDKDDHRKVRDEHPRGSKREEACHQEAPLDDQPAVTPAGEVVFLLWLDVSVHGSDEEVTLRLWREGGVRVVPGSYVAREARGSNPGAGRVRIALVAETAECVEAAERIVQFIQSKT